MFFFFKISVITAGQHPGENCCFVISGHGHGSAMSSMESLEGAPSAAWPYSTQPRQAGTAVGLLPAAVWVAEERRQPQGSEAGQPQRARALDPFQP